MNTLVINLTRFGDLLQTQPVLTGLRDSGQRTGLVCLDAFQGAGKLLRDVDALFALPGAQLLAGLDRGWPEALSSLHTWLENVTTRFAPDRIINITPTLAARLLTAALPGPQRQGFVLDDFGFGQYSTPWAAFLQAASVHRGCSPFNLVDLFQRVAGLSAGPFCLREPAECTPEAIAGLGRPVVAFQLGASQDYRRWPVAAFVGVGRTLVGHGFCPVLLGTRNEAHLGQEFAQLADFSFVDLIGKTDLPALAATLATAKLLLTNDTGTMHLAAGLGVPVMAIFLATAQPWDTGPYLEGSISLEPDLPCHPCTFGQACPHGLECRERIRARDVGQMAADYLSLGRWIVPQSVGARVWRAKRDNLAFMNLESLSGHEDTTRTQWIRVQRHVYRHFLDQSPLEAVQGVAWADSIFQADMQRELDQNAMLATLIQEQARLLALRPASQIQKKFLANCQNFQDVLGRSSHLGVLHLLWQCQSAEESQHMERFALLCAQYRGLFEALRRFF